MLHKNIQILFALVFLFFNKILPSSTFFFGSGSGGCCPCAPPPVCHQSCPVCAPPIPPPIPPPVPPPVFPPIPPPVFSPISPQTFSPSQAPYGGGGCSGRECSNFSNEGCNGGSEGAVGSGCNGNVNRCNGGNGCSSSASPTNSLCSEIGSFRGSQSTSSSCNNLELSSSSSSSTSQQYIQLPASQYQNFQQLYDVHPPSPPLPIISSIFSPNFENNYASSPSQLNSDILEPSSPLTDNNNDNGFNSFISQPFLYTSSAPSASTTPPLNLLPHQIHTYIETVHTPPSTPSVQLTPDNSFIKNKFLQDVENKDNQQESNQSIINLSDRLVKLPSKVLSEPDVYEDKSPNIDDYENSITTNSPIYLPDTSDSGFSLTNISENDKRTTIPPSDTLNDNYSDNSYKKKVWGVQQVPEIVSTGDPKCSSETLRLIMHENIVSSPTISKQLIFSAGRLAFGQSIDVICSKNKFSYTVISSKIYCEASRGRITCFAFLQP